MDNVQDVFLLDRLQNIMKVHTKGSDTKQSCGSLCNPCWLANIFFYQMPVFNRKTCH